MKNITLSIIALFALLTANAQVTHYATSVIDFSSQYSETDYAAQEILGEPDVYPNYQDDVKAWAHETMDASREYMVVGFDPMPITKVQIFETYACGAIDTIYIRNESNGEWVKIYETTAVSTPILSAQITEVSYTTAYNVDAVRFAVNSWGGKTTGWQEYDAVAIVNDVSAREDVSVNVLQINPNPAIDMISVTSDFGSETVNAKIFDLSGKQVFNDFAKAENGLIQIPFSLNSGIYILKLEAANKTISQKFIVE